MQYRQFGRTGFQAPILGFGAMRMPLRPGTRDLDEPAALQLVRHAIDRGISYVDSAYVYHNGQSEGLVGKALQDGYRARVKIATKLPIGEVSAAADFDRLFAEQLARLQTDRIDFYLPHGLKLAKWEFIRDLGFVEWVEGKLREGRIGAVGFSFHDTFDAFKRIIGDYDWSFCQIQYNYLDEETQAGSEGLLYAAAKGLPVVIMEPLIGGQLANPPAAVQAIWDRAARPRKPAEWALQWLWHKPEVTMVLSGMSTPEQIDENVASADRAAVGSLTAAELQLVAAARDLYESLRPVPCTQCQYCMPCPNEVDIPTNFHIFNRGMALNELHISRWRYRNLTAAEQASSCLVCRECEEKCPQGIPIGDWLPYVGAILERKANYEKAQAPARRRSTG